MAPEQAFDLERQDWHDPMPYSELYAGPNELLQPTYSTEPLEELNAVPDFDTPQTANPSRGKVKKRNRVDSDTASNWRDESDPVKRRRLANIFYARQSESKQRAEVDARNRAFMERVEERQQAGNMIVYDVAQASSSPQTQAKNNVRLDVDTVTQWRDEQDPVERRRLAHAFRQRSYRERQRAKVDAQDRTTKMASETQNALNTMGEASQPNGGERRDLLPDPEKP